MTRDFLKELGLEKDTIDKIMSEHGKDIEAGKAKLADVEELKSQIADKDKTIADLNQQIKEFDGDAETIKTLQETVKKYEKAEAERKQAEKDAENDRILTENIMGVIGDKEFVNDFTKNSIIAQVKEELSKAENKGKGAKDIFDAITKDSTDIFKNPQQTKLEIPPTGDKLGADNVDEARMRAVMGLPPLTK